MSANVLVIGEALMDIVQTGDTCAEHPGGSPANVALGLGRLGRQVQLLTRLGNDPHGHAITEHLRESNVTVLPESVVNGRTSSAIATIGTDGAAEYTFDIAWSLPPQQRIAASLIHSGSIATFLQPGADTVRDYLAFGNADLVSFDPNIRPALIGSQADAVRIFEETASLADIVKLSDEDAAWLYPDVPIHDVLAHIRSLGSSLVAATLRSNGAVVAGRGFETVVPAAAVDVQDTIGAGDTFMAALLHRILELGTLPTTTESATDVATYAAAAAAITVGRAGANLPWNQELAQSDLR